MQYEFLIVKCNRGDFEGIELFVDPYFREQFEIPHPTEHYAKLLQVGVCMTVTECVFVDPYLREQFEIPHPTEHYAKLLQV